MKQNFDPICICSKLLWVTYTIIRWPLRLKHLLEVRVLQIIIGPYNEVNISTRHEMNVASQLLCNLYWVPRGYIPFATFSSWKVDYTKECFLDGSSVTAASRCMTHCKTGYNCNRFHWGLLGTWFWNCQSILGPMIFLKAVCWWNLGCFSG